MKTLYLEIAGYIICINFFPSEWQTKTPLRGVIKTVYKGFILSSTPSHIDFTINIIDGEDVSFIKVKHKKRVYVEYFRYISKSEIESYYRIGFQLFQKLLRVALLEVIDPQDTLLIHGSAAKCNGGAYIFLGPSGAGKSTIIKLLDAKYRGLGDDFLIIKREKDKYFLYQTPFLEKAYWIVRSKNRIPLKKVFFIYKSKDYKVKRMVTTDMVARKLLKQLFNPSISQEVYNNILNIVTIRNLFHTLYFGKNKKELLKIL